MTEPNAEAVIKAAAKRRRVTAGGEPQLERAVQKVSMQSREPVEVADDDPRVANLVRMGLTVAEARSAIAAVSW